MTPAEEKQQYVKKLTGLVGYEHEDQFKRLPAKTLKALLDKVASVAPAPASVGG
jgi:hypothetical protein